MKLLFAILILLIVVRCNNKPHIKSKALDDEYAIINLALKKIVQPTEKFRKFANPYFNPNTNGFNKIETFDAKSDAYEKNRRHEYDSIKSVLDTARIYIFISDSLYRFYGSHIKRYISADYGNVWRNKDTLRLIKNVVNTVDTITRAAKLDFKQVDPVYDYVPVFEHTKNLKNVWSVGTVYLSRVCMDRSKTKACIFAAIRCGGLCGKEEIIFFIKKTGQGKMLTWDLLSVS